MASLPSITPMPARRQSCDRCHGQKLRCVRDANSDLGACMRCLRQGAQCVYSLSLPKGRPSLTRWFDDNSPAVNSRVSTTSDSSSSSSIGCSGSVCHSSNSDTSSHSTAETTFTHPDNQSCDEATIMNEELALPLSSNFVASWLAPSGWPEPQAVENGQQHDRSIPDLHTMLKPPPDPNSRLSRTPDMTQSHGLLREGCHSFIRPSDQSHCPDMGIAQLSQLSIRLCQLYRSTEALHEAVLMSDKLNVGPQGRPCLLVDGDAFKLVAAWLVDTQVDMKPPACVDFPSPAPGPNALGGVLCGAFSASSDLLGILRNLNPSHDMWDSSLPHSAPSMNSIDGMIFAEPKAAPGPRHIRASGQHSNTVISHLLIACHTQLLSIYDFVLTALQRDADLFNAVLSPGHVEVDGFNSRSFPDIQSVMVVQLCSFLVNRQNQAVSLYLSSQPWPPQTDGFEHASAQQSSQQLSIDTSREFISRLMMDVQHRIACLLQTLHI
ncbi:Fusaric acid cluster transcription factor FUB10 [Paramyrothecium foliicola]|nr:Fusaric acid cluster transcription factor FUB10 [Paramyrothecium foliicola]